MLWVGLSLGAGSCGLLGGECADCAAPPQALGENLQPASVQVTTAPPEGLWWVPVGRGGFVSDDGDSVDLDEVVTTSTSRGLRVPATMAIGTAGAVDGVPVLVGAPVVVVPDDALVLAAASSPIAACASACSTLLDPQAHPAQFQVSAVRADVDDTVAPGLALDIWGDGVAADDGAARFADTVAVDGGFDQSFFRGHFDGALRVPLVPATYQLRLRRLLDGATSDVVVVTVE